jgi:hypothetical protein
MNKSTKRLIKRVVIKTIQPAVRGWLNLVQRVAEMDDREEKVAEEPKGGSSVDYLNYWQVRIVDELRQEFGHIAVPGSPSARPHYVWGVLSGAYLARALGVKRISVIEFGVAGGNGLVVLEEIAGKVGRALGVEIDVYGFDTGTGNPRPTDYRDVPNLIQESDYRMDVGKLRKRLKKAQLVLGSVDSTVPAFIQTRPAPVAFASFDFALYSATSSALKLFEADQEVLLPRVQCYFVGTMGLAFSDFTADRLAISEFNTAHPLRKLCPCHGLDVLAVDSRSWARRIWLAHFFDHKLYGVFDGIIKVHDNPLIV